MKRYSHWILAAVLGLLTVIGLAAAHRSVGYVRDEGIYFDASRSYGAWMARLAQEPSKALEAKVRDRYFAVNHEHPPLMKLLAGTSARLVAQPAGTGKTQTAGSVHLMPEGAAMRLPAQMFAGLGVMLLFLAGHRKGGLMAGLLAAGWFIALPRVWFNAGLHTFDVPVSVAVLWVVLAYRAALHSRRFGLAVGPLLGIAIAVKHNALFVGPLLAVHYYTALLWERYRWGTPVTRGQWLPLPMVSMIVLAPLCALALWPWLWSAPIDRLIEYFTFHSQHSWYNMEFLGVNYNQPPMPWSYAAVMTWATVPSVLLACAGVGLVLGLREDARAVPKPGEVRQSSFWQSSFWVPKARDGSTHDGLLWLLFAVFPLALIAWPGTPIFGGTKHWLPAYPFLALAAAHAWTRLWAAAGAQKWMQPAALALILGPSVVATVDGHPYNLSQYAPLAGGPRGAAELGLNRGFWGHAVLPLLPEAQAAMSAGRSRNSGLHLHDLHELARRQYAREDRWTPELKPAALRRARAVLIFHELHMTTYEVDAWTSIGSAAPIQVLELDDVPLTSLYAAP